MENEFRMISVVLHLFITALKNLFTKSIHGLKSTFYRVHELTILPTKPRLNVTLRSFSQKSNFSSFWRKAAVK